MMTIIVFILILSALLITGFVSLVSLYAVFNYRENSDCTIMVNTSVCWMVITVLWLTIFKYNLVGYLVK